MGELVQPHTRWQLFNQPCGQRFIEDVQKLNKIENGVNLNGVLDALRNTQLKELDAAIQSKDPVRFEVAYRETMKMCNECHRSSAHEFIRIGIPERKPVANRIYEPAEE